VNQTLAKGRASPLRKANKATFITANRQKVKEREIHLVYCAHCYLTPLLLSIGNRIGSLHACKYFKERPAANINHLRVLSHSASLPYHFIRVNLPPVLRLVANRYCEGHCASHHSRITLSLRQSFCTLCATKAQLEWSQSEKQTALQLQRRTWTIARLREGKYL
jgi:hypothetical protein